MDWQAIETAPKDGAHILGWDGKEMTTVRWVTFRDRGWWELISSGFYAEDSSWEPTHWQPLPSPPSAKP